MTVGSKYPNGMSVSNLICGVNYCAWPAKLRAGS